MRNTKVTINDIAKEAGVSTATVSRALNGLAVRDSSRKKVEAAVKKLDYVPNYFARGLSNKRSLAVGVLITSMSNSYYMEITEAIEKRLGDRGYMLLLCSTGLDAALERKYLAELMSSRVDGCIVVDPLLENYSSGFLKRISARLPLVLVHPDLGIHDIDSIVIDQALGMRKVLDYLDSLGHKDICFVRGRVGHSYDIKEAVWRAFRAERGAARADERLVIVPEGNSSQAIFEADEAFTALLAKGKAPSAVFACNDLMARGVLRAIARAGLSVPGDISVCGHDNSVLAISGHIALSTVDLKMRSLGRAAVDLLFRAMDGIDSEPLRVLLSPELVVRDSTGPSSAR